MALQGRLLRVLQEREVLRVGATEPTPVNVRVIAATHRQLPDLVQAGRFRLDLYYRLNILRLEVPALRERLADLPVIAQALHARICHRLGLSPEGTKAWLEALLAAAGHYSWPGNVRELDNLIERLMVASAMPMRQAIPATVGALAPELLSSREADPGAGLRSRLAGEASAVAEGGRPRRSTVSDADIRQALIDCQGDRQAVAQRLGLSRTTLWRRMRELG